MHLPVIRPFGAQTSAKLFLYLTQWYSSGSPWQNWWFWQFFFKDLSCMVSLFVGQLLTISRVASDMGHMSSCGNNNLINHCLLFSNRSYLIYVKVSVLSWIANEQYYILRLRYIYYGALRLQLFITENCFNKMFNDSIFHNKPSKTSFLNV